MKVELVPIETVRPYEKNPRHNDSAVDAVAKSLREFGFRQPLVVDREGVLVVGHTRLRAAQALGLTQVPVHVALDLTPEQAKAYRIADNATASLSSFDYELLPNELLELKEMNFDLGLLGFDDPELQRLLNAQTNSGLTDPDDIPAPPDEPITRRGDQWRLGRSTLLCGDAGSVEDMDRLLGGEPVHMLHCDPPYGVKVEPRSNNAIRAGLSSFEATHHQKFDSQRRDGDVKATAGKMRPKDRPLEGDFLSDEDFEKRLDEWFRNIARVLPPGAPYYAWGGYANLANYPPALKRNGLYFSQCIVWDKMHPVLTRKDYLGAFEICFYGWKEGAAHKWYGPNNIPDLWHVKKIPPQQMQHLTQKSVELAARAITYSSQPGETVLDPFGGSGSTLIGALQTGRIARIMEIDCAYADLIVDRFQRYTGTPAILERTGDSPIPMGAREENMR